MIEAIREGVVSDAIYLHIQKMKLSSSNSILICFKENYVKSQTFTIPRNLESREQLCKEVLN